MTYSANYFRNAFFAVILSFVAGSVLMAGAVGPVFA